MRVSSPPGLGNMALEEPNGDFPYLPSGAEEVNRMIEENGDLYSDSQCKVCSAVLISDSQKLAHYQSKKHANKVRRYMSLQKEEEPAIKRFKSPSADSVSNSASSNGDSEERSKASEERSKASEECSKASEERSKACHVCNMTFTSPVVAESHYQGKVHTKNLKLKTFGPQSPAPLQAAVAAAPPAAAPQAKSPQAKSPQAKSPQVKSEYSKDDPNRFCSICHASFNNPLMAEQHYVGKKHKKQLTKQKLMETYGPSTAPASSVKGYPCAVCSIELNSVEQYQAHISGSKHKNQMKKGSNRTVATGPPENPAMKMENPMENPVGENQQPESEFSYRPEGGATQEDWGAFNQDYE